MDNLNGKFRAYDPQRQREAQEENKLSELKTNLLHAAERKLVDHLQSSQIEGGSILSSRVSGLEFTQDQMGYPVCFGRVFVEATFYKGNSEKKADFPVEIIEGEPEIIEKDFNKALEDSNEMVEASPTETIATVRASAAGFKIKSDSSKYLKVFHADAYGDLEPIGAVSKREYVESENKEQLLKNMFQDEATAWPAEIEFIEAFEEPEIIEVSTLEEALSYVSQEDPHFQKVCPCAKRGGCVTDPCRGCHIVAGIGCACESADTCKCIAIISEAKEPELETHSFKSHDSTRFSMEQEQKTYSTVQDRMTQRATIALVDHLKAQKQFGNFKVRNTETSYDPNSRMGSVIIQTELLDGKDTKLVPFTVVIADDSMTLPTIDQITSNLKEAKVIDPTEVEVESTFDETKLKKKASANAPKNDGYQEVLRMPKEFLPASLREGDVIEVDGLRYKLTSKQEGQLSRERNTASHWLFERVRDDYSKPKHRSNY